MFSTKREAVIIGGGAAGCASAIQLAKHNWRVTLIEKNTLFSGTSIKTPGRMGLGFHYIDFQTSVLLMKETIRFTKTFSGFRVGENLQWSHPLRHGRYFIAKDSLFPPSKILFVYESLKNEYFNLVASDPSNMVFGPPEDFYRVLDPKEYENDVNINEVSLAIETAEHLLNCEAFAQFMVKNIEQNENITIEEHCELLDVIRDQTQSTTQRFTLVLRSSRNGNLKCVNTDYVVNSTWYEIERLNSLAGFKVLPTHKTNRLKVLLEVELPDGMWNTHSMFFCIGPFCMFSNLGNGKALITYAPVTNIEMSNEVSVSCNMTRLLNEGPSEAEYHDYSEKILNGAIKFIPKLRDAVIKDLRFGIVQTHGDVDIHDRESAFHGRAYFGVREEERGWLSNPCMKLLFFLANGDITTNILEIHYQKDNM